MFAYKPIQVSSLGACPKHFTRLHHPLMAGGVQRGHIPLVNDQRLRYFNEKGDPRQHVDFWVSNVRHILFNELDEDDAELWGFQTVEELWSEVMEYDPLLQMDSPVTAYDIY